MNLPIDPRFIDITIERTIADNWVTKVIVGHGDSTDTIVQLHSKIAPSITMKDRKKHVLRAGEMARGDDYVVEGPESAAEQRWPLRTTDGRCRKDMMGYADPCMRPQGHTGECSSTG